ncbi:SH3 domain-containing protein [Qingshengfaniella alkalisoli]|uniref:SH3 domain-containing protein n=1 Tax=Qingshengfaniella alkalisoli TaxID=2599296 RepID=A0A5B8IAF3_9RHOB|nr:SH3 domain-containing protein [Qingshengfaniella alkalisoli]QDY71465.1 SH3 domain-containing protein [Qingshengfaniella alkalisoli]
MRRLLMLTTGCLIFLCQAGGSIAGLPDEYPALFDITDVASDDELNIRAAPNSRADIIGSLPPDRTDVEVLRLSKDRKWARVGLPEQSGWVAVRYLAPQPVQPDNMIPVRLRCNGTEPFWSLHIPRHDQAEFERMPDPTQGFSIVWQSAPAGRTDREMAAILSTMQVRAKCS